MGFAEFAERFATEEACRQKVFEARWPDGFVCPKCGGRKYCYVVGKNCYQCNKCKHQTTPKVGTLMEKSRLPYKIWLWAIYLIASDKRGISAMELMRQLHVTYKTAWYLAHRIREAMSKRDERYFLIGTIEFDDAYFGGPKGGGKRGRGSKKTKGLIAVSKDDEGKPKHLKLLAVPNLKGKTIKKFAEKNFLAGATIETDALSSYRVALKDKWLHEYQVFDADKEMLVWLHTILSNVKALIAGTFHGLDEKHMQRYFDEICYRFNRRFIQPLLFDHLLFAVSSTPPLGLKRLVGVKG
jgi:hypothetical protein